jgi:hypothetical protein
MLRAQLDKLLNRARRACRDERALALPLALGVLVVLSGTAIVVLDSAGSNARSASYSKEKQVAFTLGEAGINNAMAVLTKVENNALDPCLLRPQPPPVYCPSLPPFTNTYDGGTVEWYGVLDQVQAVWQLTSTGKRRNPTGAVGEAKRVLTARVPVVPTNTQPSNNPSWNYIMSKKTGDPDGCDMEIGNTVEVKTNLYVFGNLCLKQQAKVLKPTANPTALVVNGRLDQQSSQNTVGTSSAPIAEAHIANGCKFQNAHWHPAGDGHPFCSSVDMVYATILDSTSGTLSAPIADFQRWWDNASPGPTIPCNTGGPIPFDNNAATTTGPDLSVVGTYNLTPATSYTCTTLGGELSWDATAKVLTVRGTIYFDGHIRIEPATANVAIDYNGQSSIYAYGTIVVKNVKVCASLVGSNCDFATWDPNTTMMSLVANGSGGQSDVSPGESIVVKSSQFQGSLYGTNNVVSDTTSKVDGPQVGSEVVLGQSVSTDDYPNITTVPAGMPGAPTVYAQANSPEMFSG